jgi:hypothetical protein
MKTLVLKISILLLTFQIFFTQPSVAQLTPASPPIADPADQRFHNVTEDLTTPSLSTSSLHPVDPLFGYVNDNDAYTVDFLQLQWRFGDPLDLYVIKPKGVKKPPVILYLYGYPAGTDRFKDEAFQEKVTKDGFAAVGFVSALTGHRYHDRPMREWFVSELQESLAKSAHDIQLILNYLEARGDLDMSRVGMYSQGSGATIAILTSAVDPRLKVLDAIDPWGDWPVWFAHSTFPPEDERAQYLTPDFLKKAALLDPVDWLARIKAKNFRLQDATFETTTPKGAKEKLRSAVPAGSTVVIYKTPEDFNSVVRSKSELTWIEQELRSLPDATPARASLDQASPAK